MKAIEVNHVSKEFESYGHWRVRVEVTTPSGNKYTFSEVTTDSQAIDQWDEGDENFPETGRIHLAERIIRDRMRARIVPLVISYPKHYAYGTK